MALRNKRAFRITGYALAGLVFVAFALRVLQKVLAGEWLDEYSSATLIRWNYGSAFVFLVFVLLAALVGGCIRLAYWLRERRELNRLERNRAD